MVEYIKREAVLRAVQGQRSPCRSPAQNRMLDCLKAAVIRISAADVAPVVHGWWNADETCSVCGEKSTEGLDAVKWDYWLPDYCPHCGAKMDGGADHEDD